MNVLREAKDLNTGSATVGAGQIGLNNSGTSGIWPFIQLYSLNPTGNVVVQYNKGGVQSTTLTFDTVDQYAGVELDRTVYPRISQVHATVTDLWLNIDPTDEDSGLLVQIQPTQQVLAHTTKSLMKTEHLAVLQSTLIRLANLMCDDNCRLLIDTNLQSADNAVLTIQDNDDTIIANLNGTSSTASPNNATNLGVAYATAQLGEGSVPVTITEQGPNSGVFGTYDESDVSVLIITDNAARGTSASIDYNETPLPSL